MKQIKIRPKAKEVKVIKEVMSYLNEATASKALIRICGEYLYQKKRADHLDLKMKSIISKLQNLFLINKEIASAEFELKEYEKQKNSAIKTIELLQEDIDLPF